MTEKTQSRQQEALRALPSVDALLRTETALALRETVGAQHLAQLARMVTEEMRAAIQAIQSSTDRDGQNNNTREALLAEAVERLERACRLETDTILRRVINASGVILHTNLGRAPLSVAARRDSRRKRAATVRSNTMPGLAAVGGAARASNNS